VTGFLLRTLFEGVGLPVVQDSAMLDYGCHREDHGCSKVDRHLLIMNGWIPFLKANIQTKQSCLAHPYFAEPITKLAVNFIRFSFFLKAYIVLLKWPGQIVCKPSLGENRTNYCKMKSLKYEKEKGVPINEHGPK
jgi:hypothetical protein